MDAPFIFTPTPTEELKADFLHQQGIRLWIKRDDLTHPIIQGNKWRKLKYNIQQVRDENKTQILTFGGAFSNHIAATAAAGKLFGIQTIGIIRGEELHENSNPTLQQAAADGMQQLFVSRESYRKMTEAPDQLRNEWPDALILPEGGTNEAAIKGCREILPEVAVDYDLVILPVGTGGTLAGVLDRLPDGKKLLGISALKGQWQQASFHALCEKFGIKNQSCTPVEEEIFGGYGRYNQKLIQFILDFSQEYGILLDPIYTGKMFYNVWEMIKNRQIAEGTSILAVHTGGLQGIKGFNERFGLALPHIAS